MDTDSTRQADTVNYFEPAGFYGTEEYHRPTFSRRLIATDGAIYTFKTLQCFWVSDVIASYMKRMDRHGSWFFTARVVLDGKGGADFILDDGNYNVVLTQKIPFTDLTENLKFFIAVQDDRWVVMLPSEY